ncbi:hypothetical protein [Streptomyces sp. NBC_01718]|uniref:hypothetical protein n=1 Tax=Streptomyces sp. NBC_01718 TaxID=2975919 RepID=UPI00352DB17D
MRRIRRRSQAALLELIPRRRGVEEPEPPPGLRPAAVEQLLDRLVDSRKSVISTAYLAACCGL